MLHAARLQFPHPEGRARTVEAALPADFAAVLQAARLR
jgi:tRNA pseudouridine32 synthase/23S rRNA pseudouridine746 synthase